MSTIKRSRIGPKSERSIGQPNEMQDKSVAWREETRIDRFKKTRYGKPVQAAFTLLNDYCGNSTLHGVRYFVERKRHWLERVWWIGGFLVSLYFCGALINNVYGNWDRRSIILSFAEAQTPVWDIPFPAVTICPSTIVQVENFKFHSFDTMLHNNTERELKILSAFNNICGPYDKWTGIFETISDNSIIDFIREIAVPLNYAVVDCFFPSFKYNCTLETVMTDMGLCFTFNMLNGKETYNNESSDYLQQIQHNKRAHWNLESGYDSDIRRNSQTYPLRAFSFRDQLNLKLLSYQPYLNNTCNEIGNYVLLHAPGEIPQLKNNFFNLPIFEMAYLTVIPKIITTSQGLRAYTPDRRQCYFKSERKLRFLKLYTQRNCELECLSNFTLSYCGCVDFYMLREANTPICGPAKKACCLRAVEYSTNGPIRQVQNITEEDITEEEITRINKLVEECNCLPACTSIAYDVSIIKCDVFKESDKTSLRKQDDQVSKLNIFFKENEFITLTRSEIYGTIDFIANCGGLIGLFTGASFLSIVELLYYCSLRLYCNRLRKRNGKRENEMSTVSTIIMVEEADNSQAFQLALKHDETTRNEVNYSRKSSDRILDYLD